MCTSNTGPSKALSASRIAIEVCVKAPGLMTIAAAFFARLVDPVDQLMLGVGLQEPHGQPVAFGLAPAGASTSASVSCRRFPAGACRAD
jgi:hypothetical protein